MLMKTQDDFLALIEKDIRAQGAQDKDVKNFLEQSVRRIDFTEKDALDEWAFVTNKGPGDTYVEYGENSCTVFYLIRPGEKITTPSANALSILISGEDAEEVKKRATEV